MIAVRADDDHFVLEFRVAAFDDADDVGGVRGAFELVDVILPKRAAKAGEEADRLELGFDIADRSLAAGCADRAAIEPGDVSSTIAALKRSASMACLIVRADVSAAQAVTWISDPASITPPVRRARAASAERCLTDSISILTNRRIVRLCHMFHGVTGPSCIGRCDYFLDNGRARAGISRKAAISEEQYRTVQPIYYPGFTFGGISEPVGMLMLIALTALDSGWQRRVLADARRACFLRRCARDLLARHASCKQFLARQNRTGRRFQTLLRCGQKSRARRG